jgi:hypothetical protein
LQGEKRQALPPRHELKYYINPGELEALRARLYPVLRLDAHCENGPYAVRSLYFDDAYDRAYHDKLGGVMNRDKYRIRIYNNTDRQIFLERKRKTGDRISKSSVQITRRLCERLIAGDPWGLHGASNPLLREVFVAMRTQLLRPRVIVEYAREAYTHPVENVRITLDMHLRSGLSSIALFDPDIPMVSPLNRDVEILEIKFDRYLPDYIAGLLVGLDAERSAISKYVLCRRYEPLQ